MTPTVAAFLAGMVAGGVLVTFVPPDRRQSGERHDPVDGTHHLGNVMACAAILLDAEAAGKVIDDRPPSVGIRETYAEIEAGMAKLREQYKAQAPTHYTIADTKPALEWPAV